MHFLKKQTRERRTRNHKIQMDNTIQDANKKKLKY